MHENTEELQPRIERMKRIYRKTGLPQKGTRNRKNQIIRSQTQIVALALYVVSRFLVATYSPICPIRNISGSLFPFFVSLSAFLCPFHSFSIRPIRLIRGQSS